MENANRTYIKVHFYKGEGKYVGVPYKESKEGSLFLDQVKNLEPFMGQTLLHTNDSDRSSSIPFGMVGHYSTERKGQVLIKMPFAEAEAMYLKAREEQPEALDWRDVCYSPADAQAYNDEAKATAQKAATAQTLPPATPKKSIFKRMLGRS